MEPIHVTFDPTYHSKIIKAKQAKTVLETIRAEDGPRVVEGKHLAARLRARRALEMRLAGRQYKEIARELHCGIPGAMLMVDRALQEVTEEPAKAVLQMELLRLDKMISALWDRVELGDLQAIDRVLRIQERRARFMGLDAPVKVAKTDAQGNNQIDDDALVARLAQLAEHLGARRAQIADAGSGAPRLTSGESGDHAGESVDAGVHEADDAVVRSELAP